jgi:hypothetical protein
MVARMTHWFDILLGVCVALLGVIWRSLDLRIKASEARLSVLEEYRLETVRGLATVEQQSRMNGEKLDYLIGRCDARWGRHERGEQ